MSVELGARMNPSAVLFATRALDCVVALVRYSPNAPIPAHAHAEDGLTVVLDGAVVEETRRGSATATTGWTGLRPAGTVHANRFGPSGAYVLGVIPDPGMRGVLSRHWRWRDSPLAYRVGLRFIRHRTAPDDACVDDLADLLAAFNDAPGGTPTTGRMRVVRERLEDADAHASVAALAKEIGIHPVVLARQFRAVYGMSPREYRTLAMARRALQMLVRTKAPISEVAHTCGFADHSHMCRAFRTWFGWSPRLAARYGGA
jgi:AraC family transcriptional regulator